MKATELKTSFLPLQVRCFPLARKADAHLIMADERVKASLQSEHLSLFGHAPSIGPNCQTPERQIQKSKSQQQQQQQQQQQKHLYLCPLNLQSVTKENRESEVLHVAESSISII